MGYTTLAKAKNWVKQEAESCDADVLRDLVNDAREYFYSMYDSVGLFMDFVECHQVQRFPVNCHECTDHFHGISLPRGAQNIEAIWFNSSPITIRTGWREWQIGIQDERACNLQTFPQGSNFPTELELNEPSKLKVIALDPADSGKTVTLSGIDVLGRKREETLTLKTDYVSTEYAFRSLNRPGGVVKDQTKGEVIIADETSRILSRYAPDETLPSYVRIKIVGLPDDCNQVNVRSARKYHPLFNDNDVVEIDSKIALVEMARYIRLNSIRNKQASDIRAANTAYAGARAIMLGNKSRDTGKSAVSEVKNAKMSSVTFRRRW